jgi:hypothetical protein
MKDDRKEKVTYRTLEAKANTQYSLRSQMFVVEQQTH